MFDHRPIIIEAVSTHTTAASLLNPSKLSDSTQLIRFTKTVEMKIVYVYSGSNNPNVDYFTAPIFDTLYPVISIGEIYA